MVGSRSSVVRLAIPGVVFLSGLGVLAVLNRSSSPSAPREPAASVALDRSTDDRIRALQGALRDGTTEPRAYALLGEAYLQKARETGDPSYYKRAEVAVAAALRRDPRDVTAVVGAGTLALARHDFSSALRRGLEARRLAPGLVRPYGVVADAQVELGRYRAAARTLQRMIDLKPNLASYARVSYFRQLHGDLAGAVEAMRLAASAGSDAPEHLAYVQTLLGDLEFERGRVAASGYAYRTALQSVPGYLPADAGLARVLAARGDLERAIRRYRGLVARRPLPEHVIALGELELAAGRPAAARRSFGLVGVQQRLLRASGVNADVELALFEADHGDPHRAVRLARRYWASAPSVRAADALGWALTNSGRPAAGLAWARRALTLGSRDPRFLYHAGISAQRAGRVALARAYLRGALALNPRFSPLYGPRARRALEALR
jgi:tetratricopeptide (TPR) repeat protein